MNRFSVSVRCPFVCCRAFVPAMLLLLVVCGGTRPALAQVLYGSIVGNITDSTGGGVPGATVTIKNNETAASHDTVTDATGAYRFGNVQPGTYTVTVMLTGFRTFTREHVPVTLNSVTRVDAPLQVGQLSEMVTVSGESPVLQTDRAEVRAELKATELVNLPVSLNRNYQYLFRVLPGFTPPAEAHQSSAVRQPDRGRRQRVKPASQSGRYY